MRDKLFRSIAFAVVAAITVGVAPSLASVDSLNDGNYIVADGMIQQTQMRRVYKRTAATRKVARKVAAKKSCGTVIVKEKVIEKPVVIEKQVEALPPAAVEETTVTQPAVVESSTPVIIDRYEKRHRSLIHLGLFPINLLGE
jgi:hypothetical protein